MDRLTRGFHRIGLTVAIPASLVAAYMLIGGYFLALPNEDPGGAYFIGLVAVIIAVAWYGLCRALAWIINGFRETA